MSADKGQMLERIMLVIGPQTSTILLVEDHLAWTFGCALSWPSLLLALILSLLSVHPRLMKILNWCANISIFFISKQAIQSEV